MRKKTIDGPIRVEYEVFGKPYYFNSPANIGSKVPMCLNGNVYYEKWRVIMEKIEEPVEILAARLLDLWETSNNIHDWSELKAEAKKLGIELPHERLGKRRPKR